jgi:hypothetical protein
MKKTLKIALFSCLFLYSFSVLAQTTEKEYLDAEKIRIDQVYATEVEIEAYISTNLSSYVLTQTIIDNVTNGLLSEGITAQTEIDAALLEAKKSELRKLYFITFPNKVVFYNTTTIPYELRLNCLNGGFENSAIPTATYSFFSSGSRIINGCATLADTNPQPAPANNNFNARATVMSSIDSGYLQFDPTLNVATRGFIQIPTISPNGGNHSIKLNVSNGGKDVTTMRRNVFIGATASTLDYEFSLLLQDSNHNDLAQRPFFRVDLIVNGVVVNTRCIRAEPNCIFTRSHATSTPIDRDILYSGWRCDQIDVTNYRNRNAILEFTIGDCGLNGHFGTVYIDNICGFTCASPAFGALTTNPLNSTCPDLINNTPYQVCGTFTPPINSVLNDIVIGVSQNGEASVPITGGQLQITGNNYCFSFNPNVFGNSPSGNTYQFQITANYTQTCSGLVTNPSNTTFASVTFTNCCYPNLTLTSPGDDMTNLTIPISTIHLERSDWITASNFIGIGNNVFQNGVVYHALNFVDLTPGFDAINGSQFAAYPEGCSASYVYRNQASDNIILPSENETKVELIKTERGLSIHPNPSSNSIEILMKNAKFKKVSIVTIDGKMVFESNSESTDKLSIDVSTYANGIYIVTVISDDGQQFSQKLIKN